MARRIYLYDIEAIPDCTHYSLVSLCGGNVRESIFRAFEHLLRMVSNFQEGQITLAFRFIFNPGTDKGIQQRLKLQLAVKINEQLSASTVSQLIDSGPLAEFYKLCPIRPDSDDCFTEYELPYNYNSVCEIVRQEQRVQPLVTKQENPGRIPSLYYTINSFEARQDNDYMIIDSLLSRMDSPCSIQFTVCPVDQSSDLKAQYKYIRRLMSVNEYSDDTLNNFQSDNFYGEDFQSQPTSLGIDRKKDPLADDIAREHQEFHQNLRRSQLLFNIKTFAATNENTLMLASTIAEAGLSGGKYNLISYGNNGDKKISQWYEQSLADTVAMDISLHAMFPDVWNEELPRGYQAMGRLCRLATVDELKGLIRLPVGGHGSPRCIRKTTDPRPQVCKNSILIGDDLESGIPENRDYSSCINNLSSLFESSDPANLELRLPLETLTKHMFVSGVPGSGKTTAIYNLLIQLYRMGKPFLVIESAKTEYRILKTLSEHKDPLVKKLAMDLRIYSPGKDDLSAFRFNPLWYPEGITEDEHVSQVLSCFEAAMPVGGPLQALIAESVGYVYNNCQDESFPGMRDLVDAAAKIMKEKKYEGEVKSNLQAAIEVRLGMLTNGAMGRIFNCKECIPDLTDLLDYPTIIEMDALSQDRACLLTLFVLSAVREKIKTDPGRRKKELHHVTVIEEAHNIVGRTGQARASEEIADPKAFAAQYISRMLAELRALGEGIVIADQLPSAVASEVVKNTGTKLAYRLVSNEDREDLGGAMLMGNTEVEEIARLQPGEGYFYTEGLYLPRKVKSLNANVYLGLADFAGDDTIFESISQQEWFIRNTIRRTGPARILGQYLDQARECKFRHKRYFNVMSRSGDFILQDSRSPEQLEKDNSQRIGDCLRYKAQINVFINNFDIKLDQLKKLSDEYLDCEQRKQAAQASIDEWHDIIKIELMQLAKDFYMKAESLKKNHTGGK